MSKVFERLISGQIVKYLKDNDIIRLCQFQEESHCSGHLGHHDRSLETSFRQRYDCWFGHG